MGRLGRLRRGLALVLLLVAACADPTVQDPGNGSGKAGAGASESTPTTTLRFEEVTPSTGVDFTYCNGVEANRYAILETLGGGAGILDYDVDGESDAFLTGGGGFADDSVIVGRASALYRNRGSLKFANVAAEAGCDDASLYTHGVTVGDYDADGFADLLVTGYGGVRLWHNCGDGTFVAAAGAGLADDSWSTGAAWGDVNGDGHLDLYIAHYVDWDPAHGLECRAAKVAAAEYCSPRRYSALPDTLYVSRGDGSFKDASAQAGLRADGKGLGVLLADLDGDGDLDIYVTNDTTANFLYTNDGTGKLEESGLISGTALSNRATPDGSMGVDLGDFNGDGLLDLWVSNFEHETFALYRNDGRGQFTHVSQIVGVTDVGGFYVGWGTAFADYDLDGDADLLTINGHLLRYPVNTEVRQRPLVFENRDRRLLVNVAERTGEFTSTAHEGRGLAIGDLDKDGDCDLVVSRLNEPVSIVLNESLLDNHWVGVRLIGTRSHRDAIGAVVRVVVGNQAQVQQVHGGGSYMSASDRRLIFGVGSNRWINHVEIRWPSGVTQKLTDLDVDRMHTIVEPALTEECSSD